MGYILLIVLILNTAISFATIFKKRIEETICISIFSYIIFLFLLGMFINLNIGFYLILILNVICFIYNIISIKNKKINIKEQIFTTGLICVLASYALAVWYSLGRKAVEWDEFSHWALTAKNMYLLGDLGLGENSTILLKQILSGTSIFQFFALKLCGSFKESMLYVAMNLMVISTIIPMLKNLTNKKSFLNYLLYGVIFFIPMFAYPSIYSSIYVDGILGLVFAYTLYSYYTNNCEISKFSLINLTLSLSVMVLLKDFGIVFAAGTVFIILMTNTFAKNKFSFSIKEIWNRNKYILLSAIPMLAIKAIWTIGLKTNHIISTTNTSGILPGIKNFLTGNLLDYQKTIVSSYIDTLFTGTIINTYIPISFVMVIGIAIVLGYVIISKTKEENKKTAKMVISLSIIGALCYAVLLLIVPFLSVFPEYEALRLVSYTRYMNSYIIGLIIMEIAVLIKTFSIKKESTEKFIVVVLIIFILNFPFTNILNMTFKARTITQGTINQRAFMDEFKNAVEKHVANNEKTYFIATNTDGYEYHVARYEITPKKMNDNCIWSMGQPYDEKDIWTYNLTKEEWKEELLKNYDYVYLYNVDEPFIENYGQLFLENNKIENNQLYRVIKERKADGILEIVE